MSKSTSVLQGDIEQALGDQLSAVSVSHSMVTIECSAAALPAVARSLRDTPTLAFRQLSDLAGVDYSAYGEADWQTQGASTAGFSRGRESGQGRSSGQADRPRYAVVMHLLSIEHNCRVRLRAFPEGEPPTISSVTDIWPSANWFEREAFDLFGILFDGHDDLRRLLTDYGFIGHPFRKDFPLEGHVEVRFDPAKGRVVYQPVTIENRVLVPRVIRDDNSYGAQAESAGADDA